MLRKAYPGRKKKIDELIGNLGTRYWDKAADELVKIGEAAVEPLIETLNIGSGRPAENAVLVLARIGTPKAMEAVIGALKDPNLHHRFRTHAAMALGDTGSEDFIVPLIEALQTDSHWWVRNFAVGALGKIGSERVIDPLIRAMNDENQYVRRAAVSVLGRIGYEDAVALSRINSEGAVEPLKKKKADRATRVGQAAAWALARIKEDSRNEK